MKKIITIILIVLINLCSTGCAASYHIEWFDIEDVSRIEIFDKERIAIFKELNVFDKVGALCNYNGESLTEYKFASITRLKDNLYGGYTIDLVSGNGNTYAMNKDGSIIESGEYIFMQTNTCLIPGENIQPDLSLFKKNNLILKYIKGHFAVVCSDNNTYALTDLKGNLLSDFNYNHYDNGTKYFGKLILFDDGHDYMIVADPYLKKYLSKVLRSSIINHPKSIVYVNENNKYAIAMFDTLESVGDEYDEFIDLLHGNYSFLKDGKTIVTDVSGNVIYSGEIAVRKAEHNSYIVEENDKLGIYDKDFNVIFPCEYESADIVAEDLYIVKKNGVSKLFRQGKEILSSNTDMNKVARYISTNEALYDFEGKFIIKDDWTTGVYVDHNFIIYDENTKRAGKLVSENSNPLIEINGEILYSDTLPRIKNNITLMPLRAMAEETGFNTEYIEETKEIRLTKEDKEIIFKIGDKKAISNGVEITLEAAPEIINNRTLIPARAVSDAFGYDIEWDGERRLVMITTN